MTNGIKSGIKCEERSESLKGNTCLTLQILYIVSLATSQYFQLTVEQLQIFLYLLGVSIDSGTLAQLRLGCGLDLGFLFEFIKYLS